LASCKIIEALYAARAEFASSAMRLSIWRYSERAGHAQAANSSISSGFSIGREVERFLSLGARKALACDRADISFRSQPRVAKRENPLKRRHNVNGRCREMCTHLATRLAIEATPRSRSAEP
jgi:hypothetical protein